MSDVETQPFMLKTVQLIAQKTFVTYSYFWKLTLVNSSPKTFSLSEKFWDKIARGKEHDLSTSLNNVQGAGQRPKAQIILTCIEMQTLKPLPQMQCVTVPQVMQTHAQIQNLWYKGRHTHSHNKIIFSKENETFKFMHSFMNYNDMKKSYSKLRKVS